MYEQIEKYEENQVSEQLNIPKISDKSEYKFFDLKQDQKNIIIYILSKLQKWLLYKDRNNMPKDCYVRMIVAGKAGSGKSTLINTLVSIMRQMFQFNNVIQVAAPTGIASNVIGGKTMHRL